MAQNRPCRFAVSGLDSETLQHAYWAKLGCNPKGGVALELICVWFLTERFPYPKIKKRLHKGGVFQNFMGPVFISLEKLLHDDFLVFRQQYCYWLQDDLLRIQHKRDVSRQFPWLQGHRVLIEHEPERVFGYF